VPGEMNDPPQILVLSTDLLFPTTHGGRVAMLGQCRALRDAGFALSLVVFHRDKIDPRERARHLEISPNAVFIKRPGFLRALLRHPLLPYQAGSRTLSRDLLERVAPHAKSAVAIMAHQEWTLAAAAQVRRIHAVPVILCSQNDEFEFLRSLVREGRGVRKGYFRLELARLKVAMRGLLRAASVVTILSDNDRAVYTSRKKRTVLVPPVLTGGGEGVRHPSPPRGAKIVFVGALDLSHSVSGLLWFIREVLPIIRASRADVVVHVAGRRANQALLSELKSTQNLVFHGEIADSGPIYRDARVFINPIFGGSGVNMKMGPPSELGIPIVTTTVGLRGLDKLAPGTLVGDDVTTFAEACLALITDDAEWSRRSSLLQQGIEDFSIAAVGAELRQLVTQAARPVAGIDTPTNEIAKKRIT
jgi:polysaccharide biosynthesis protein PslH